MNAAGVDGIQRQASVNYFVQKGAQDNQSEDYKHQ
jgi:hypothetical protein